MSVLTFEEFSKQVITKVTERLKDEPWFVSVYVNGLGELYDSYCEGTASIDDAVALTINETYFYDGPQETW